MVNPDTGIFTPYEEVWRDEQLPENVRATFITNETRTRWQACVGDWQLGMGRTVAGAFWAWQATKNMSGGQWSTVHKTPETLDEKFLKMLPEKFDSEWAEGAEICWEGERWIVLEHCEF